ncbi:MAG TPA: pyridoxal phosphate-dependent aminotransferase [Pyrinomonadaceae bacterium]|jgi:aspartate/methionine/tyrosine aminotransferase|nr:pyridoxal phosphate-dependent aminotransferase [Pyrinomonadaceae bacterium]
MTAQREVHASNYMNWAKTQSRATFNLATSGLDNLELSELDVSLEDIALTGTSGYGYPPLLDAIAKRMEVGTDSIITATGTSLANHLAMAAVVNPGDEVLIEQPTYEPLLALARYLGAKIRRFERRFEDSFAIHPAEIEKNISPLTRLIVLTNHHNPSGVLADEESLREVGELAQRVNARVLVDEVYLESMFDQRPPTALHLGPQFMATSSLTKAFGLSGLRCGWIVSEPGLAREIWLLNDLFGVNAAHPAERLSVCAFAQLEKISAKARSRIETNRALLNEFLDMRDDLETVRSESGTTMFPRVRHESSESLCRLLREKYETSVVPGSYFEMPAHFRVGLGGGTEVLRAGLERLGKALDELRT